VSSQCCRWWQGRTGRVCRRCMRRGARHNYSECHRGDRTWDSVRFILEDLSHRCPDLRRSTRCWVHYRENPRKGVSARDWCSMYWQYTPALRGRSDHSLTCPHGHIHRTPIILCHRPLRASALSVHDGAPCQFLDGQVLPERNCSGFIRKWPRYPTSTLVAATLGLAAPAEMRRRPPSMSKTRSTALRLRATR
jgi:hypothetical protein